jgi:hypothetical protein
MAFLRNSKRQIKLLGHRSGNVATAMVKNLHNVPSIIVFLGTLSYKGLFS